MTSDSKLVSGKKVVLLSGVSKYFNHIPALEDVDLWLDRGEILGYVGPNGAGKTTTIRLIAGLIKPTKGTVQVFMTDPWPETSPARTRFAFLPEVPHPYDDLTVYNNLLLFAKIHRLDDPHGRIIKLMQQFSIAHLAHRLAGTLSKGMRQRLLLARLFVHDPELLLLDEPTSGLDPRQQQFGRELLREFARNGGAVLLSSHNLYEIEEICDRVIFITRGRICSEGKPADLLKRLEGCKLRIVPSESEKVDDLRNALLSIPIVHSAIPRDGYVEVLLKERNMPDDLSSRLQHDGIRVRSIEVEQCNLTDYYQLRIGE